MIPLLASKLILKCLERENVEFVFGYPGGALLPLYEAFRTSPIKHILVRNEQTAPHYASGYARESGRVGVCLATSGPGATNLVTGIATAYLDSIPIVAITGQVDRALIGTDAFQEADITGATAPFTKHSYLVQNAADIPRIIREAFHIASTGRPGPVLIDIPRDVQLENVKTGLTYDKIDIMGYKPNLNGHSGQIKRAIKKIKEATKPVIYAGGGVVLGNAQTELLAFAEKNNIPVITSLMGIGGFPEDHPLYCGIVGSHGYKYSNVVMNGADLIINIGARMSNRATSQLTKFEKDTDFVHIDIDPAEIGKNMETNIPIVGDAKTVLSELVQKDTVGDHAGWLAEIETIRSENPLVYDADPPCSDLINPKILFKDMSEMTSDNATVVGDVGLNQIWSALYYRIIKNRRYYTSGGLGTMGYSIPAACGAAFATLDKPKEIFIVCGDGSFQMSMGELGVIAEHQLNVNIILITNTKLGMVRQLQFDNYGKGHYSGTDINFDIDFMKLAEAYGIKSFKVDKNADFNKVLPEVIKHQGPTLIQCQVHPDFIRI
ncbi:Acetolactate synthase large subunit [Acetobacterium wieringae]|uniref:Acetolactate synthase n=2 Tax=Acetobacterium wieringae TaxID=52694 RepID=A0A1F2PI33_9FIRM|nr:biosynthetic-type acetolactate synthase large subunit [Acetobacterium wieringae]OFV70715.1 acetolactate synthase large subunit [Acetobacterium wieringae]VUZ28724.1 Acetolactate synthase large subunit [Acetobacterium wieringae]